MSTLEELYEQHRRFVQELRERYPQIASDCGVLLHAILEAPDIKDRTQAAHIFGVRRYRRGVRKLEAELNRLLAPLPEEFSAARRFISSVILIFGWMDTKVSHAVLRRLLHESIDPWVKGEVLEAMAFERDQFDLKEILPYATAEAQMPELLSALYAIQCHWYGTLRAKQIRKLLEPLLAHPHPRARMYTVEVLGAHRSNWDLIRPLSDDPDQYVRQVVKEALSPSD